MSFVPGLPSSECAPQSQAAGSPRWGCKPRPVDGWADGASCFGQTRGPTSRDCAALVPDPALGLSLWQLQPLAAPLVSTAPPACARGPAM